MAATPDGACRFCELGDGEEPLVRVCECEERPAHASCLARAEAFQVEQALAEFSPDPLDPPCPECGLGLAAPAGSTPAEPRPVRIPWAWAMALCSWLVDLAFAVAAAQLFAVAVQSKIRTCLTDSVFAAADADGSGLLSVDEAVALARATGDDAGAEAVPRVIRHLDPLGQEALSENGLARLYLRAWEGGMLAADSEALGLLVPAQEARGLPLGACRAQLQASEAVHCPADHAAVLVLCALCAWFCAWAYIRRHRAAVHLGVVVVAQSVRACAEGAAVPSLRFWAGVLAACRPRPRRHPLLCCLALGSLAQSTAAAAAWAWEGRLLRPRNALLDPWLAARCALLRSDDPACACHPSTGAASGPAHYLDLAPGAPTALVMLVLAAADLVLVPALGVLLARRGCLPPREPLAVTTTR